MNGGNNLNLVTLNENLDYQVALDQLRDDEGFDFAGLAFYENENQISPIKWHYVSGNLNNRYKLIVLRKGRGLAGTVMKTGKRMIIENVNLDNIKFEKHKYPIIMSESLTAMIAIPLWYENYVYGVLLLGQRNNKGLPKKHNQISITNKFGIFKEEY